MDSPRVWGATLQECARHYACDGLGFVADDTFFRAVDVAAPPELVYAWLTQLRVAPYSYDLLDNFGRRSPPRRNGALATLAPGMIVMTIFRVVNAEHAQSLTVALGSRGIARIMGDFCGTYAIERARDGDGVRLVAKILVRYPPSWYGDVLRRVMPTLDLIMFRKQLETLRDYAEREARLGARRGATGEINPPGPTAR